MKRRKGRIFHKLKPITIRQIIEMVAQEALTKTSGSYNYNQLEAEILGNSFPTKSTHVSSTESSVKLQIDGEQVYIIWWQVYITINSWFLFLKSLILGNSNQELLYTT